MQNKLVIISIKVSIFLVHQLSSILFGRCKFKVLVLNVEQSLTRQEDVKQYCLSLVEEEFNKSWLYLTWIWIVFGVEIVFSKGFSSKYQDFYEPTVDHPVSLSYITERWNHTKTPESVVSDFVFEHWIFGSRIQLLWAISWTIRYRGELWWRQINLIPKW